MKLFCHHTWRGCVYMHCCVLVWSSWRLKCTWRNLVFCFLLYVIISKVMIYDPNISSAQVPVRFADYCRETRIRWIHANSVQGFFRPSTRLLETWKVQYSYYSIRILHENRILQFMSTPGLGIPATLFCPKYPNPGATICGLIWFS